MNDTLWNAMQIIKKAAPMFPKIPLMGSEHIPVVLHVSIIRNTAITAIIDADQTNWHTRKLNSANVCIFPDFGNTSNSAIVSIMCDDNFISGFLTYIPTSYIAE